MLIIIGLLLFVYWIEQTSWQHTQKAAWLIFLAATFVMGWRSADYTPDNIAYARFFELNAKHTLAESWQFVLDWQKKDPFFHFLGNVFSKWEFSYRGWFVFIAGVYMGGFCYLMYKRSCNFFLSFFLMVALGYFYFAMTGLRQTLAFGCCFFAFEFLCRRKLLWFILCVLTGSLFHSSGLVFLLMYPLSFIPFGPYYIIGVVLALPVAFLFPNLLRTLIEWIAWNDDLEEYIYHTKALTATGYFIEMAIFVFCLWGYSRKKLHAQKIASGDLSAEQLQNADVVPNSVSPALKYFLTAVVWGAILRAFAVNIDNFFRIAMYFSCYSVFAIPELIATLPQKEREMLQGFLLIAGFAYIYYTGHFAYFTMFEELQ